MPPRIPSFLRSAFSHLRFRAAPKPAPHPLKSSLIDKDSTIWAVKFILKYGLVAHLFMRYVGFPHTVVGISMVPTIWSVPGRSSPWLLTSTLHRRGRNVRVGDVIMFTNPLKPQERSIKRVVGMPGDFVAVVTPGKEEKDLLAEGEDDRSGRVREEMIRVPEGHCWVAGDNLSWSRDSRTFGPVPLGLVKGKVVAIFAPWSERRWIGNDLHDVDERELLGLTRPT
ncbi:LexA/Signal peptidase [Corynespora cassiicola Philippines]|uniref:Mitochondrial inner membrane protease subunit n=1 Tax=Corynespora cassiicola Philippines TaxID=1448308 RepID=A0A2T2NLB2_CORCC|nr:LexA/Signal peptidase [Corynespora cassiicola Philippines]